MIADRSQRLRPDEVARRRKFCHKAVGQPPGAHRHNVRAGIEIHRAVKEAAQIHVASRVHRHGRRLFMRRAAQRLGPDQFARRRQLQQKQIGRAARSERALARARIEVHLPRKRARHVKVARGVQRQRPHLVRTQTADTLRPPQAALRVELRDENIAATHRRQVRHPGARIEVHGPAKGTRGRHIAKHIHRHDGALIPSVRSVRACPGKRDVPGHAQLSRHVPVPRCVRKAVGLHAHVGLSTHPGRGREHGRVACPAASKTTQRSVRHRHVRHSKIERCLAQRKSQRRHLP